MWATRPHLGSIFEKLLHRKTFQLPAALNLQLVLFYFDVVFHVKHSEIALKENGLSRPAKGGSTPAFACQHAAIAPLPCPNLQLVSQRQSNCELASFKKCNCSRKNLLQNSLLRKCGLLAHTSAAFLKNCCTEKLSICPAAFSLQSILFYFDVMFHVKHCIFLHQMF